MKKKIKKYIEYTKMKLKGYPKDFIMQKLAENYIIGYDEYCEYINDKIKKNFKRLLKERKKQLKKKIISYDYIVTEGGGDVDKL